MPHHFSVFVLRVVLEHLAFSSTLKPASVKRLFTDHDKTSRQDGGKQVIKDKMSKQMEVHLGFKEI